MISNEKTAKWCSLKKKQNVYSRKGQKPRYFAQALDYAVLLPGYPHRLHGEVVEDRAPTLKPHGAGCSQGYQEKEHLSVFI
jgi:hypothetical protein